MAEPEAIEAIGERFWDFGSDYGVQIPLTDAALAECERALGVVLPPEYVALLRVRNGGAVAGDYSAFLTAQPTSWAPDHVPFEDCSGIGDAFPSITDSPDLNAEWGQPEELVLLHGDGHWWVALDYRAGREAEPAVVWFDNEVGEDVQLAASFGEFVRGLTVTPPIED